MRPGSSSEKEEGLRHAALPVLVLALLVAGLATAIAIRIHDRHAAEHSRTAEAVAHRSELVRALETKITAYARGRVARHKLEGPIVRTRCQLFQRTSQSDLSLRRARYSCTAVRFETDLTYGGYLFVGEIDFATGRMRFHRKGIPIWLGI